LLYNAKLYESLEQQSKYKRKESKHKEAKRFLVGSGGAGGASIMKKSLQKKRAKYFQSFDSTGYLSARSVGSTTKTEFF
jgi:hypothetical protein